MLLGSARTKEGKRRKQKPLRNKSDKLFAVCENLHHPCRDEAPVQRAIALQARDERVGIARPMLLEQRLDVGQHVRRPKLDGGCGRHGGREVLLRAVNGGRGVKGHGVGLSAFLVEGSPGLSNSCRSSVEVVSK